MGRDAVVTCFLLRRARGGDRILLLRRSGRVGTYRGRWAGVSGYLEAADPLDQAYRELSEEVGLAREDLRLLARGQPLDVPDPRAGRRWLVHPFLFEALAPGRLRLDWEHVAGRWVRPRAVFEFPTVPMLPEALMRVYPLVPPSIREAAERIRADRQHGARELAMEALRALLAAGAQGEELRTAARALARSRPSMAAVANAVAAAYAAASGAPQPQEAIAAVLERLEAAPALIARRAREALPGGTLITLSYSSTVVQALAALRPRRVIVSEGRPLLEGRAAARALAREGIPVTLITEGQLALLAGEAEAAVVGADTVFPDGSFANKVGTRLLALAARRQRLPLYVLSETLKVAPPSLAREFAPEEGDPREVLPQSEGGIEARNVSFEVTPPALVTAYVTEEGVLSPRQVRPYARRAQENWRRLFRRAWG